MKTQPCPDEEMLLTLLLGDSTDEQEKEHLASCESCQQRAASLRAEVRTLQAFSASHIRLDVPAADNQPTSIGRYLVVGSLGSGAQGRVYRGLHPRLGVEVAIKWGDKSLRDDPSQRDALTAEGQVLARLSHPNLVRVLDLDVEDDRPFLVLEFIRGGDLGERAKTQRVSPQQAAAWVAQLARALAVAHAQGVVHQDVKPRNVLIDPDGQARLSDFGLARLRQSGLDGPIGGTLVYMAPEQAAREVERIGPAADIFGLGGVLFFLLTGQPPYTADNPILVREKAARGEVSWDLLEKADAPRGLKAVCRRAMAQRPEDRYPSAEAMAGDLDGFAGKRSGVAAWLIGLAAVLMLAVAGYFIFRPPPPSPMPPSPQPLIVEIHHGGPDGPAVGDIQSALTLGEGDQFCIQCDVPRGYSVLLITVDSEGTAQIRTDFARSPVGNFDRIRCPDSGALDKKGPPGTELVLVCASRKPIDQQAVKALVEGKETWPKFTDSGLFLLSREKVESAGSRGFEKTEGGPWFQAHDRLEAVRQKLAERCEFVSGVLYRYDG